MTLARTRRRTEDCEPVGKSGDGDEDESDLDSSRSTLQAELEVSLKRSHSPKKAAAAPAYDPVSVEGIGTQRSVAELA